MISVNREFGWDMGHRVPNHESLCKNPHGHRYKLVVEVSGPMNDNHNSPAQGMVLDFGDLKKQINEKVINALDHSFIYWEHDKVMGAFAQANPDLRLVQVPFVPTAECIVAYLAQEIQAKLNETMSDIQVIRLALNETPSCQAIWVKE